MVTSWKEATCLRTFAVEAVFLAALMLTHALAPVGAQTNGKELLEELIAKARREGALNADGITTMAAGMPKMVAAFKKRFNLDIDVQVDVTGSEPAQWTQLAATMKAGATAPLDLYIGNGVQVATARDLDILQPIGHWQELLAEINPAVKSGRVKPEQVSWGKIFGGYAFVIHERLNAMMYNTTLMQKDQVPPGLINVKDPPYKGKYAIAPYPTMWQMATLVYPRNQWLQVVDQVGKNAATVLTFAAGSQRVALGEFAFMPLALQNVDQLKAKDASTAIAAHYFSDVVSVEHIAVAIPRDVPHPAAAALFTLWMTTPEAESIWQPILFNPNVAYGESKIDQQARAALSKAGSKVVSWFDNDETLAALRFYGTKEGRAYRGKLVKALTQRK